MSKIIENTSLSDNRPSHRANLIANDDITEILWRKYVRGFLSVFAALCCSIATVNFLINPFGLYSTRLVKTPQWNARHEKATLMKGARCQAIILGSSHAMKISPVEVKDLTGFQTFNAAVDMATVEDEFALLRTAVEGNHWPLKLALVAVDPETFSANAPTDMGLKRDSELSKYVASQFPVNFRWEAAKALLSIEQTSVSFQTLNWLRKGAPSDHHFDVDGYLHYDLLERAKRTGKYDLTAQINSTKERMAGRYRTIGALSTDRQKVFLEMLNYCQIHGIRVKIFILPLHPSIRTVLLAYRYDRLLSETVDFVRSAAQRSGADFYNLSDLRTFQGHNDAFFDGEHIDEVNARLITTKILEHEPGHAIQ